MRIFKSTRLNSTFILAVLTSAALLSACGQKGPLKLPPTLPPEVAPTTSAQPEKALATAPSVASDAPNAKTGK